MQDSGGGGGGGGSDAQNLISSAGLQPEPRQRAGRRQSGKSNDHGARPVKGLCPCLLGCSAPAVWSSRGPSTHQWKIVEK